MASNHNSDQIHIFSVNNKLILYDQNGAKFFDIDVVTKDILDLGKDCSETEIRKHLKERYSPTQIDEAINEIKLLTSMGYLFPGKPQRINRSPLKRPYIKTFTLITSGKCNLRCRYCWNQGGRYNAAGDSVMSKETAKKAVDFALKYPVTGGETMIDFYGGEPLMNFDVVRDVIELTKSGNGDKESLEKKQQFSYKITTNGTLLSEKIVDYLSDKNCYLAVSFDGAKEVHDHNRPFASGAGSWAVVNRKVSRILKSKKIEISVRATLMPPYLKKVETYEYLAGMGFNDIEVEFANEPSYCLDENQKFEIGAEDKSLIENEILHFTDYYLKELLKSGRAIDVGTSNRITQVLYESPKTSPCGAGCNTMCVSADGKLYPCLGFNDIDEFCLGNVEDGLDKAAWKRFVKLIHGAVFKYPKCKKCWARYK